MPLKTTVRMRGIRSPILTLAVITSRFYAATCARKENGRMVANPDGTAFFGDYFRVAVTRPALWETKISRPATFDECIGDLPLVEKAVTNQLHYHSSG
jgi:hypothetical protein